MTWLQVSKRIGGIVRKVFFTAKHKPGKQYPQVGKKESTKMNNISGKFR